MFCSWRERSNQELNLAHDGEVVGVFLRTLVLPSTMEGHGSKNEGSIAL